jgi:hypothetical protein
MITKNLNSTIDYLAEMQAVLQKWFNKTNRKQAKTHPQQPKTGLKTSRANAGAKVPPWRKRKLLQPTSKIIRLRTTKSYMKGRYLT